MRSSQYIGLFGAIYLNKSVFYSAWPAILFITIKYVKPFV